METFSYHVSYMHPAPNGFTMGSTIISVVDPVEDIKSYTAFCTALRDSMFPNRRGQPLATGDPVIIAYHLLENETNHPVSA